SWQPIDQAKRAGRHSRFWLVSNPCSEDCFPQGTRWRRVLSRARVRRFALQSTPATSPDTSRGAILDSGHAVLSRHRSALFAFSTERNDADETNLERSSSIVHGRWGRVLAGAGINPRASPRKEPGQSVSVSRFLRRGAQTPFLGPASGAGCW